MSTAVLTPPARDLEWCTRCCAAVTPEDRRCPSCSSQTHATIANRFVRADGGVSVWHETAAARVVRYEKVGAASRKIPDEVVDLAWALYNDEQLSVGEAAAAIFAAGLTSHTKAVRLEEGLRRYFRKRGYPMRTTAQTLKGRACRATVTCTATTQRGKRCNGNPVAGSDVCWQHHPDYQRNRDALAHMERMRQNRRWVNELVPIAPLVAWLKQRRDELAVPLEQRRFANRDEGLVRLAAATGIDASTLIKWMRFESSKGKPKRTITRSKVEQILHHDATTTFNALYDNLAVGEGELPALAPTDGCTSSTEATR